MTETFDLEKHATFIRLYLVTLSCNELWSSVLMFPEVPLNKQTKTLWKETAKTYTALT